MYVADQLFTFGTDKDTGNFASQVDMLSSCARGTKRGLQNYGHEVSTSSASVLWQRGELLIAAQCSKHSSEYQLSSLAFQLQHMSAPIYIIV